jgi:uncharacterized protein (DUF1501 family)
MLSRRRFLELSLLASTASVFYSTRARADARRAKACVWLWLNGGPSHIDTFDPKPGTSTGGPFKAIRTRASGVQISEHLPLLAERADKFAVVRSMTTREGNHDRARYLVHSGYAPNPTVQHPSFGGWVGQGLEHPGLELPAFVSVNGPSMGAGFLGVQYGPFVLRNPDKPPDNVDLPRQVDEARFARRQSLLGALEHDFSTETNDAKIAGRQAVYGSAVRMMQTKQLAAFDLSIEPEAVRAAYGDHDFGKGCLIARRLVEQGVPFVEVMLDGWDTHKDNFERTKKLMGILDSGASSLLRELTERRLLDSTLVVVAGEFGRTPKINENDGRDHHPQAWSLLVGGGGIRGGQALGGTDAQGENVVERPVQVPDFMATLATLLGLDPDKTAVTPAGRPISLTDHGTPVKELLG